MTSVLFTNLHDIYFDSLCGSDSEVDHVEALEGYGIDATVFIVSGSTTEGFDYVHRNVEELFKVNRLL